MIHPAQGYAKKPSGSDIASSEEITMVRINTCMENFINSLLCGCPYRKKWAVRNVGEDAYALGTKDLMYIEQQKCCCCPVIPCIGCCTTKYHVYSDNSKSKKLYQYNLGGCLCWFEICWNKKYRVIKHGGEEQHTSTLYVPCGLCMCCEGLFLKGKIGETYRYDIGRRCVCCSPEKVYRMWVYDKEKDNHRTGKVMLVQKYCLMCCPKKTHWDIQFPKGATNEEKILIAGSALFVENEFAPVGWEQEA